jgi:hypothetical protein
LGDGPSCQTLGPFPLLRAFRRRGAEVTGNGLPSRTRRKPRPFGKRSGSRIDTRIGRRRLDALKVVTGFLGLVVGTLIGLYGLFLILYQGEEGSEGDTYMEVGGAKIDADYIGVPMVLVAPVVLVISLRKLSRRRVS